ncbi:NACHT domain [Geosmithia morbida]|uniref:NACHT domain n=1 Tax=Geosmithia morbida TaxID=1094350 RepID=A0A9P4YPW6_9HYPO|nr:NACHT domain [Geosmithia morbida]KAF4119619.1 NACHT domain [Geosmithia morbida]
MSNPEDYWVGWVCATATEYVAAQAFLDDKHDGLASYDNQDDNVYTLGRIGVHNVVIASLPCSNYGLVSASRVAKDMMRTFKNVRFGLMVGIGGGSPTAKQDIRLGDVVVSSHSGEHGAVLQYDFGKTLQGRDFKITGHQNAPPTILQAAIQAVKAEYQMQGNRIHELVENVLSKYPRLRKKYQRPDPATDRLVRSDSVHVGGSDGKCPSCNGLGDATLVPRKPRGEDEDNPKVHYGLIASANQVMKDALVRDRLAEEKGVLCFEMETAGLMNQFKCLVIRGICDYSDSHKSEDWRGYAAIVAAASDDTSGWLLLPEPSANYARALGRRHENTGQWFLDSN